MFHRKVPFQLNELQIIDCKIHATLIEQLFDLMLDQCNVRTFTLTNVAHSENSWSKLCTFVDRSYRLRELNISWQILSKHQQYEQLFEVIRENRRLVDLTIAWNTVLEE